MLYCDNAATTGMEQEVLCGMLPYMREKYGNPSSVYGFSDAPREGIRKARMQVSKLIGAKPEEIYFTSGGSESDNWAIKGTYYKVMRTRNMRRPHMITTQIEHHAILHTAKFLEQQGTRVTYLPVNENGLVSIQQLRKAITSETVLISVMTANNEIGTIEPIQEIGTIAKEHNIWFHTDAVQAFGQIPLHVDEMHIDMLSASAHKVHGPKGCGMLYIREGCEPDNFLHGGGQEKGLRGSTENVPGIVGFGKACEMAENHMTERMQYLTKLRDYMIRRILYEIPYTRLNGDCKKRLPGNVSIAFQFVDGNSLLAMLDEKGVYASAGSACNASNNSVSHVLKAIGLPEPLAVGTLRFTLSEKMKKSDIDNLITIIKYAVMELRKNNS